MSFRLNNKDRMLKPGRCVICETKPGHRVVDTGYNLVAATVYDKLRGRKYVCEACGQKIGKALGMAEQNIVNRTKDELIKAQNRIEELQTALDMQSRLEELTSFLRRDDEAKTTEIKVETSTGGD